MENYLLNRTKERIDALGISVFKAAENGGLDKWFIRDLLNGKKKTVRPEAMPKLAAALDCDPEYLIGAQAEPRRSKPN